VHCIISDSLPAVQVVFVSAEVAPWSKAGGLGDVMEALPIALANRGMTVMSVAPAYQRYPGTFDAGVMVPVSHCCFDPTACACLPRPAAAPLPPSDPSRPIANTARLRAAFVKGVLRVFVEHPLFSSVSGGDIYSSYTSTGVYRDVAEAMHIMSQVALAAPCLLEPSSDGHPGGFKLCNGNAVVRGTCPRTCVSCKPRWPTQQ
jgi:hypothetical protein